MSKTLLVVTHCQTYGLADALSFLLPDYEVKGEDQGLFERNLKAPDAPARRHVDLLVRGPQLPGVKDNSAYDGRLTFDHQVIVPGLQIDRYHPDICWIPHGDKLLWGPIGQNHSRIVFRAYQKGYDPSAIEALFTRDIFQRAGYLTPYPGQLNNLIARFAEFDIDIAKYIGKWSRQGSFMHTINHPKVECLFDISREVVRNLGVPSLLDSYPDIACCISDTLATGAAFPVYPDIAMAYGFEGSYLFKKPQSYRMLGLSEFIAQSVEFYAEADRENPFGEMPFFAPHYSDGPLAQII